MIRVVSTVQLFVHELLENILETVMCEELSCPFRSELAVLNFVLHNCRGLLDNLGECGFLNYLWFFLFNYFLWDLLALLAWEHRSDKGWGIWYVLLFLGIGIFYNNYTLESFTLAFFHYSLDNLQSIEKLVNGLVIEELRPINFASVGVKCGLKLEYSLVKFLVSSQHLD